MKYEITSCLRSASNTSAKGATEEGDRHRGCGREDEETVTKMMKEERKNVS